MALIDRFSVTTPGDLLFHEDIYEKLVRLGKPYYNNHLNKLLHAIDITETDDEINSLFDDDLKQELNTFRFELTDKYHDIQNYKECPHLLFLGKSGCGKTTLINMFLKRIFGNEIMNVQKVSYQVAGFSKIETVEVYQSEHHLIIEPINSGFDKHLVQEVIKQFMSINFTPHPINKFKVVLINKIDQMSANAQFSLRRTMEKYHSVGKFILDAEQSSKIITPLQSRCLQIRVSSPTRMNLLCLLGKLQTKFKFKIDPSKVNTMIELSKFNLKKFFWILEFKINGLPIDEINQWSTTLNKLVSFLVNIKKHPINNKTILDLRHTTYDIYVSNIDMNEIINYIVSKIYKRLDIHTAAKFMEIISEFISRLPKGKRVNFHLEALFVALMNFFYNI
jgi:replication factor C subunit 3/5